jgi:putative copper resistance protein D
VIVSAGLIVSRFLHFAAVLLLFGAAAFPLYAYPEHERAAQTDALFARLRPILAGTAALALLSGIAWLCFTSAGMSGDLANAVNPGILSIVIQQTDFGKVWIWRLALAAALLVLFWLRQRGEALALARIAGAALLLTSIAGTGHAGADITPYGTFHVAADSLHLLAASAWLGGLVPLAIVLAAPLPSDWHAGILHRFSAMGMLAVAAILLSGIVNAILQLGSFGALFGTRYGLVLIVKIAVFAIMLVFAAMNRFRLVPALERDSAPLAHLRRNVLAEQLLGLLVLLAVAVLGTLSPTE